MDLNIQSTSDTLEKILFKLKPVRKDGLVLNLHPNQKNTFRNIRFTFGNFHSCFKVLALADNNKNIYIVDFGAEKFWKLSTESCVYLKFSNFDQEHIFLALHGGDIKILKFETGYTIGTLQGHKRNVKNMSFTQNYLFLSSSEEEAILWDLRTYTMLQILDLDRKSSLKYAGFVPMSNSILACFQDDVIQVWDALDLNITKNFSPKNWKSFAIKSIAFAKNGQVMVISGYTPSLAFILLSSGKLYKFVNFSDHIQSVRHVEFVPQPFDAGFNKIMAILSQQGVIYFYNVDENIVISELKTETEIKHFEISSAGTYIACILHCGETSIYNLQQYIIENGNKTEKVQFKKRNLMKSKDQKQSQKMNIVKNELDTILNKNKLKFILNEYGQYPDAHRLKIWEHLLELPNNYNCYNTLMNRETFLGFDDLAKQYPLESKVSIIALQKLLINLMNWCQFFGNVDFLPVFAFPFVKVFQNKPIACFESVCTIVLNWCQHWFEYHPLTPFNILAIIENILYEHDPELLSFYTSQNLSSSIYAWPLLSTAFSEVLSCSQWLCFWDHVFTNEVSFLLCATAAYSTVQRDSIFKLRSHEEFKCFFENQNPIDLKRLLKTTYFLLKNLNEEIHPKQYLKDFKSIGKDNYPSFKDYPVFLFDLQESEMKELQIDIAKSVQCENELFLSRIKEEQKKIEAVRKAQEHERRIKAMEKYLLERIKTKDKLLKLVSSKLVSTTSGIDSAGTS